MSTAHQVVDILLAGLLAGAVAFGVSVVSPRAAVSVGVAAASAFYFSRHPFGLDAVDAAAYNDAIDDAYDRYLPF